MNARISHILVKAAIALTLVASASTAGAHCDTLNGPVVAAARLALQKGDVTPVLRWVKPGDEAEIRRAFEQTLVVRQASPQAKELADRYFFETLVRLHRQGEGAPYTGLRPSDTQLDPTIESADKAIEDGSIDQVIKLATGDITTGIRRRFSRVIEARKLADQSVEAGRQFVEAYVEYVHYVENLGLVAGGKVSSHAEGEHASQAGPHGEK